MLDLSGGLSRLLLLFSKHPQVFLNDFSLYACVSHSISNLDMLLLSISTFSHQFSYTSLVLGLFSSPNSSANSSIQLHETQTFQRERKREKKREKDVALPCWGWWGKNLEVKVESKVLLLIPKRRSGGIGMPETMYLKMRAWCSSSCHWDDVKGNILLALILKIDKNL